MGRGMGHTRSRSFGLPGFRSRDSNLLRRIGDYRGHRSLAPARVGEKTHPISIHRCCLRLRRFYRAPSSEEDVWHPFCGRRSLHHSRIRHALDSDTGRHLVVGSTHSSPCASGIPLSRGNIPSQFLISLFTSFRRDGAHWDSPLLEVLTAHPVRMAACVGSPLCDPAGLWWAQGRRKDRQKTDFDFPVRGNLQSTCSPSANSPSAAGRTSWSLAIHT